MILNVLFLLLAIVILVTAIVMRSSAAMKKTRGPGLLLELVWIPIVLGFGTPEGYQPFSSDSQYWLIGGIIIAVSFAVTLIVVERAKAAK
jgi:hypothetical protein